jgi:putative restriction endonuclease
MSQNYENYWKITLEYTDINGERFIGTLKIIIDFMNKNKKKSYSGELFKKLQKEVCEVYPKSDYASVRKSINQFVKLGFVNFNLTSYHEDTPLFLEAKTNRRRKSIFSKIVYTNASLNSSVTTQSNKKEINFLIKTLEEVGKLTEGELSALMRVDILEFPNGYLTKEELNDILQETKKIKFMKRKYNQVGHFRRVLDNLDDLVFIRKTLYFEDDAQVLFGDYLRAKEHKRDPYLYRIYKNQLKEESSEKLGEIKCMLEDLDYPSLVASHIKPFIVSTKEEAYDPENGLLLSRNMDILFDLGYISFKDDGKIILSNELSEDLRDFLKDYSLRDALLTKKRLNYLKFHRKKIFETKFQRKK